jgi:hypothetical protein
MFLTISSPDQQAEMQTAIYEAEEELTSKNIGQTANGLLKDLIAYDLRINASDVLQDGRIRLNWTSNSIGQTGFSFFWRHGTDLYLLTFMRDNKHPEIYQRVLSTIGDSLSVRGGIRSGSYLMISNFAIEAARRFSPTVSNMTVTVSSFPIVRVSMTMPFPQTG